MKVRADVAELLHAGYSNAAIARKLHIDPRAVAKDRATLGLPKPKSGRPAAGSPEDLFWKRVQPTDDDHMDWIGYRNDTGVPAVLHGGRLHTAYRLAFRIANGRDPEGRAQTSCGHEGCVKPGHHTDRLMREDEQRLNRLYARIFGRSA